ncbi:MAG: hypothetical protein ACE5GQ_02050 [Nitrospinales bacterium]
MIKLITRHELAKLNLAQLHQLYQILQKALAQTSPGTPERRNCLASLENIQREMNQRRTRQWKPGL